MSYKNGKIVAPAGIDVKSFMDGGLRIPEGYKGVIEDGVFRLVKQESEDERIRKELIEKVEYILPDKEEYDDEGRVLPAYHKRIERYRAYLEKQKEQKPVKWNDADMREARENLISVCRDWERGEQTTLLPIVACRARYFLEHLIEPQKSAEWSEEDEAMLENVLGTYKTLEDMLDLSTGQDRDILESMNFERDWLKGRFKFLRPHPHWKPSEEQMDALHCGKEVLRLGSFNEKAKLLASLYEDLEKL